MRVRRAVVGLLVLVVASIGQGVPRAGALAEVIAGACVFDSVTATFSGPALGPIPSTTHLHIEGSASTCASAFVPPLGTGGLSAGVDPPIANGLSCLAGAATGSGGFDVSPQFAAGYPVNVAVVNTAGIWTVVVSEGTAVLGVAQFVQLPTATASCLTGSLSSASWTGALVYEDPTLSP